MRIAAYKTTLSFTLTSVEVKHLGVHVRDDVFYISIGGSWDTFIMFRGSTQTAYENAPSKNGGVFKVRKVSATSYQVQPSKSYLKTPIDEVFSTRDYKAELGEESGKKVLIVQINKPKEKPLFSSEFIQDLEAALDARKLEEQVESQIAAIANNIENESPKINDKIESNIVEKPVEVKPISPTVVLRRAKDHSTLKEYVAELNDILTRIPNLFVGFDQTNQIQLEREEEVYEPL